MGRNWFRNLPLKIGAVVAATVGTLGFYGLIQAHPLGGATTNGTASTAAATSSDQQATPMPTVSNGDDQSPPVQQAPRQTIPRQRVSRGS